MADRKPITTAKHHVDAILRLVAHATPDEREEISAEIARLHGAGARLEVCPDCNGFASPSDDLEAEFCETCDGTGSVPGEAEPNDA